jgi:hypothetical protein
MNKLHSTIIVFFCSFYALFAQTIILDDQFANAIKKQCPTCIDYQKKLLIPAAFLRKLDVRASNIHSLLGIEGFRNLDTLDCSYNPLGFLPNNMPMGLKVLRCTNDSLVQMPELLPPLLKNLDCSANNLTKLPGLPVFLARLKCSNNLLDSFPNYTPHLLNLDCSNNKLKEIDISFSKSLMSLNCSNNTLNKIKDLPQTLEYLNCSFNELPRAPFLPYKVAYLNCSNNKITGFEGLSDSLRTFICNNNAITELPELPRVLVNLTCNNNQLFTISNLPTSLKKLDCRANFFTKAPKLPFNLQELRCSDNPNMECFTNIPDLMRADTVLPICPQIVYEKVEIIESKRVTDRTISLVPYRKKGKWGYATFEGNVVIAPQFDSVQFFKTREECNMPLAIVMVDSAKGLLDNTGDFVLKPEYSDIQCSERWGFVVLKDTASNWYYLMQDGSLVEDTLKSVTIPKTGFSRSIGKAKMTEDEAAKNIRPSIFYQANKASFSKRVKVTESYWSMSDTIAPSKFDSLVFTSPYTDTLFAKNDTAWGAINTKQEIVVPFLYDNIAKQIYSYRLKDSTLKKWNKYSLVMAHKKDMGWGIVSIKDTASIPFMFDSLDIAILPNFVKPSDTITEQKLYIKVKNEQNLWGIMDMNSQWILYCQFPEIVSDKLYGFKLIKDDKVGFFNPRTNVTIQPIYKSIKVITKGVLEVITINNKLGYIDDFGNEYFEDEF